MRPFVLHAHFYQPERINPWTGALDPEQTAAPHRDWNARILAECYRPNGAARIFDEQRRVERIVNNYERLSFNFGPTLLSWMERRHPQTYARLLDGDWRAAVRTGHGNALAQAYNHLIMPLANDHDRRTQIGWGVVDFRHRFGRDPEGMWLPETGADQKTIDDLIDGGLRFTVLAPSQAARLQRPDGSWHELGGGIDTSRPYRITHSDGSGRDLAVFFYDGGLAQSIAFDPATADAAVLLDRVRGADRGSGLTHAAMDGETFGHHNTFAELGLAYLLFESAQRHGFEPTNYGAYLAAHPPTERVELVRGEGTAWSCAHGLGRWQRDCGCSTDALPGWNQAWRGPLRDALDVVRDAAIKVFDDAGGALLKDPWAARDDYINVRLGDWSRQEFLDRHAPRSVREDRKIDLWTLLEAQRHAMVMYTSCGWFFADISGIETRYVLRSAARVLGLLEDVVGPGSQADVEQDVLAALAEARSNKPEVGTGADLWRTTVQAEAVTPRRVGAHTALLALARPDESTDARDGVTLRIAGHLVTVHDQRFDRRGRMALATGRARIQSIATERAHDLAVAAVHLGGLDFHGWIGPDPGQEAFDAAVEPLWSSFSALPMARVIYLLSRVFPEGSADELDLESALPAGRQAIVGAVFAELTAYFAEQHARLYLDNRRVLEMLTAAGYQLPPALRAPAEITLATRLQERLDQLEGGVHPDIAFRAIGAITSDARREGYRLDLEPLRAALSDQLTRAAQAAAASLSDGDVDEVERWLARGGELEIGLDIAEAQEHAYVAATRARTGRLAVDELEAVTRLCGLLGLAPRAWRPQ